MSLQDELKNIGKTKLDVIKKGAGDTIANFYNDFKHKNPSIILPKNKVIDWYNVMKEYLGTEDCIYVFRYGSSKKNKDSQTLRRGFLTKYLNNDHGYFYIDNDLTVIICNLCINGFVPTFADFRDYMINYKMPVHFTGYSKAELLKAAYPLKLSGVKIGAYGYKVSHIYDVGQNYYDKVTGKIYKMSDIIKVFFPDGNYNDWQVQNGVSVRYDETELNDLKERLAKAVFLRLLCPLNYVLTPKIKCHTTSPSVYRNDIGESEEFLAYVREELKKEYGVIYDDFCDLIMLPPKGSDAEFFKDVDLTGTKEIKVEYGLNIANNTRKIVKADYVDSELTDFYKYLVDRGYKDSTARAYTNVISKYQKRENMSLSDILNNIDDLIKKYTNGSVEDIEYGKKGHNTYINSLRRLKEYKNNK